MRLDVIVKLLQERNVYLHEIAELVQQLQLPYNPKLTLMECLSAVEVVLTYRETYYALLTGIALDMAAESKSLPEPLQSLVESDAPLFGIDEVIATGICDMYGSIGLTTFGYLDKTKMGVLTKIDQNQVNGVNTFLDDLVAAVAAAACAKVAHDEGLRRGN